jgi:lysyl-tRNA synthetase class 2
MLAGIRAFFARRQVLEVETPVLSQAATPDPALLSMETRYQGPGAPAGRRLFLQTSPEFPMKRLLAAGSGPIFQVARVFRDGEAGRHHNPEFSLLEWYRPDWDHHALMDEVEELVRELAGARDPGPARRLTYRELFQRHLDIDPLTVEVEALMARAELQGIPVPAGLPQGDPDPWLQLLLTQGIEPALEPGLLFVHDFPASQAALARVRPETPPVAERFELYWGQLELANGFHELSDANEQRRRFHRDLEARDAQGLGPVPLDERFLAALAAGLPPCAGVALGLDRLLLRLTGAERLEQVLAFPLDRA